MKALRSLKSRFILLFTLFIIALCGATALIGALQTMKVSSVIFAEQGISVAEAAASLINGDAFEILTQSLDETDPFYGETQDRLLEYKLLSSCRYLYTVSPKKRRHLGVHY